MKRRGCQSGCGEVAGKPGQPEGRREGWVKAEE